MDMEARAGVRLADAAAAMRPARRRWARRLIALALAAAAQTGLLWLTAIQQRANPFAAAETPAMPVWLASPRILTAPRSAARPVARAQAAARARPEPPTAARPTLPAPEAAAPPASGGPTTGPAATGAPTGVASALRGSLFGCANAAALGLSDVEREKCRDRLAAGAMTTPPRSGIPGEKRAYYDAILAAETKFRNDPLGGHGPVVFCYPGGRPARALPHALKIGPCYIEPPQGSLDVDVDVPEVGSQRNFQPLPR